MSILPALTFVSENTDYLLSHDLSYLPSEFVQRIGDLSENEQGASLSRVLRFRDNVIATARHYVWLLSDIVFNSTIDQVHKTNRDVSVRVLAPAGSFGLEEYEYARSKLGARFELGIIDEAAVRMSLNEKIAGIVFPDLKGRPDRDSGGFGTGWKVDKPRVHKWCRDLFMYYWEKSKKGPPEQFLSPQFALR